MGGLRQRPGDRDHGVDGAGRAEVDTDGDGTGEGEFDLADLGFTDAERIELASLYAPGTGLWRTPIPHLTPWDCNSPYAPPQDAVPPPEDEPDTDEGLDEDDPDCTEGSIIECQTQVLREDLPLVGTSHRLHYGSDRTRGRTATYVRPIKLSGPSVPDSLKRIELEVEVAGRLTRLTFPAAPNQDYTFTWDGTDAYGRRVQGASRVRITKSYFYDLVYTEAESDRRRSWFFLVPSALSTFGQLRDSGSKFPEPTTTGSAWAEDPISAGGTRPPNRSAAGRSMRTTPTTRSPAGSGSATVGAGARAPCRRWSTAWPTSTPEASPSGRTAAST